MKRSTQKGRKAIESELFDGEYFIQKIKWEGLNAPDPVKASEGSWSSEYSDEARSFFRRKDRNTSMAKDAFQMGFSVPG